MTRTALQPPPETGHYHDTLGVGSLASLPVIALVGRPRAAVNGRFTLSLDETTDHGDFTLSLTLPGEAPVIAAVEDIVGFTVADMVALLESVVGAGNAVHDESDGANPATVLTAVTTTGYIFVEDLATLTVEVALGDNNLLDSSDDPVPDPLISVTSGQTKNPAADPPETCLGISVDEGNPSVIALHWFHPDLPEGDRWTTLADPTD